MRTITYTCDACKGNIPYHPVDGPTPNKYGLKFYQVALNKQEYPLHVEIELCRNCESNVRKLMYDRNGKQSDEATAALENFLVSIATKKT